MNIKLSEKKYGEFGIVGHAGCGHANSHCGFVQDDSGGLSVVATILQQVTGIDLRIDRVDVRTGQSGSFSVHTVAGGQGHASSLRGITPFEATLAQSILQQPAICSQTLSMMAFGRTLGQGAMTVPVALQTAIANACIDSFAQQFPHQFITAEEGVEGNIGRVLGTVLDIDGIAVSIMGLSNATQGGIGPNEDVEGNVNLAGKGPVMHQLRLDEIPTILLEGKVCAQPISSQITTPTFVTRAFPGDDNYVVSECLQNAAQTLGYPVMYPRELLARKKGAMQALTQSMGQQLIQLGHQLAESKTSREKVRLAAKINQFASEDLGGITFMSDSVHEVMGGVGAIPGTTGCLSLFIPTTELEQEVFPALTPEDCRRYVDVVLKGIRLMQARREESYSEVDKAKLRALNHGLVVS